MAEDNNTQKTGTSIAKKTSDIASAAVTVALGMASTNKGDLVKLGISTGRMILRRDFNRALSSTYEYFMKKGSLDENYFSSPEWADLSPEFDIINGNNFGKEKLDYLRKIFANLALNPRDANKKYLLDIALKLSEPQIKILIADFNLSKQPIPLERISKPIGEWRQAIAQESGLEYAEMISLHDGGLVENELLTHTVGRSNDYVVIDPKLSRLSDLGYALCSLMMLEDDPVKRED